MTAPDYGPISQFNAANDEAFVWADPDQLQGVSVALEQKLIDELDARDGQVSIDPEAMSVLLDRAAPEAEQEMGITLISAATANAISEEGARFLTENPDELGYCASWGAETEEGDFLELFVVIDPARYNPADHGMSDESVQAQLSLNLTLIMQLLLVASEEEFTVDGQDDGTAAAEQAEARAENILNTLLDDVSSPPIVIADRAAFAPDSDDTEREED